MVDVSVKATLTGAEEAKRGLENLAGAVKSVGTSQEQWVQIQANLNKVGEEHRTVLERNASATQKLKDHTSELVRQFNEQERATALAMEAGNSMASTLGAMAMRAAGTVISVAAVVGALHEIAAAGREADMSQIRLDAILKATGSTVGLTTKQLNDMADALAESTRFDSTGIKEAMTILLTFDNVQGGVFERTLRHAQNLSEEFGLGLTGAARLLGRALEEPGQGISALQRYIGNLDPTLKKHIKDMAEAGDTAGAQAEILKILDGKYGDLAVTVGTSAPAAFDRMTKSVKNLFEELGKGQSGGAFDYITERLDNIAGWVKNWSTIRQGIEIEALQKTLSSQTASDAQRLAARQRLGVIMKATADKEMREETDRNEALIASEIKAADDKRIKLAALAEKQAKANEARQKKERSEYEAQVFRELELDDILIAQGEVTLEEKIAMLDFYMQHEAEGTAFSIRLANERSAALNKIADMDLTRQKAVFQQGEKDTKAADDAEKKRLSDRQKDLSQQMDEEIAATRKIVFATNDLRFNAIEELARAYVALGLDIDVAYKKARKGLENVKTQAEMDTERLQKILGSSAIDTIGIMGGMFNSIQSGFAGVLKGTMSLGEGIKSIWHGIADAIIDEISRIAAKWILEMAGITASSGGGGGSFGSSILSLAARAAMAYFSVGTSELGLASYATWMTQQHGGESVVTSPTMFMAGELGPERVSVSPLASGARGSRGGGGGITNIFNGPTIMDAYTMTLWLRGQRRMLQAAG